MLETDSPWCDLRPTHASAPFVGTKFTQNKKERFVLGEMVKSRNEPCTLPVVLSVVAAIKGIPVDELAYKVYQNCSIFGFQ